MKQSSRFYSSLGLLILLNAVIKPLWIFGIDRQVQNTAGTEAYGHYFAVFGLAYVLGFLLDWGLTTFLNRMLSAGEENGREAIAACIKLKIVFAFIYLIVVAVIAYVAGLRDWTIILSLAGIQILGSFFVFFRGLITAAQWFGTDAWLSVLDKTLMIIFCGSFLLFPAVTGTISIHTFLYLQLAATLLALIAVKLILWKRKILPVSFKNSRISKKDFQSMLPFGLIVLLMSMHNRLDGFLLERLHPNGAHEAGLYAGAYRLLDAFNMAGFLIASFLLPYIAKLKSENKNYDGVVLNARHLLVMVSLWVTAIAVFISPAIIHLLYRQQGEDAIPVMQYCLPVLMAYSITQVYGTVLTASGRIREFCVIVLVSVVINIILNLWLIPAYGAKGSAIAALVSQGICGIACMVGAVHWEKLKTGWRSMGVYLFMAILLYFYFSGTSSWNINRLLIALMALPIMGIIAVITGLLNLSQLKKIQNH
ncbi:MAG: polysaccharide biosynthesis C-terminal domain-containing protein [Chitinophagaceae bacterium]|nr:polysaccharide biosynthesis C-terminal domain-containing protein [Chitinophagaceae bacterium]